MKVKRVILIISVFLIFITLVGAYASNEKQNIEEVYNILNSTNSSELTGCCSVACQLEGNNGLFSFRRDAPNNADIHIEKIDWHGKPAIKQYKTDGGYFCQVIVTNDGWVIGYGGIDDGIDNQRIENITADVVLNNNIDNGSLEKIENIKKNYGIGHTLIKSPDGTYGVAMVGTKFTGKLNPGDYISVPNKPSYVRTGNMQLNTSDKIEEMNKLATSDMFGLTRRDVTTFSYYQVNNSTYQGNNTDIYISNDDGSMYGMNTGKLYDDVYLNDTVFKKEDIPISPKYATLGSINFTDSNVDNPSGGFDIDSVTGTVFYFLFTLHICCLIVFIIRFINKYRYMQKRKRGRR